MSGPTLQDRAEAVLSGAFAEFCVRSLTVRQTSVGFNTKERVRKRQYLGGPLSKVIWQQFPRASKVRDGCEAEAMAISIAFRVFHLALRLLKQHQDCLWKSTNQLGRSL